MKSDERLEEVLSTPQKKRNHAGGAQPGAGRISFNPTGNERRQVELMAGLGLPMKQIAALVRGGIGESTLRDYFAVELVVGKAKTNQGVANALLQKALGGDTQAQIWWTKARLKWSDVQKHELTGKGGGPIKSSVQLSGLSPEELDQLEGLLTKAT